MISEKPPHAQTTKARWRGEVKIQSPLGRVRATPYLVTSECGSICEQLQPSRALRRLMNSRMKAYFKATLLGDGTLDIRHEVPERPW